MMSFGRGRRGRSSFGSRRGDRDDSEALEPSPVVHVSDLPEHTVEADLLRIFSKYGKVKEVCTLPHRSQAFIEFEDLEAAAAVVEHSKTEFLSIAGRHIRVHYSTSQEIVHRGEGLSGTVENHVLLFTVYKANYPVTVDVLHKICSPHGQVLRIIIFRKNHPHAMVEFARIEDATKAKRNLNGADIYSGCCTIKVEYALQQHLTVSKNDHESWDYENEQQTNASLLGQPDGRQPSLLREPRAGREQQSHMQSLSPQQQQPMQMQPMLSPHQMPPIGYAALQQPQAAAYGAAAAESYHYQQHAHLLMPVDAGGLPTVGGAVVLMIYGLSAEMFNCQRMFNLLCLYGNVMRVKFLRSMEGAAMVQMGDPQSVDRAIQNLNSVRLFGQKLQVSPSKQASLVDVGRAHNLPDGTPSFVDFSYSRNNRYITPKLAAKNKIYPPFRTLHFWNCPPQYGDEELRELFARCGCEPPEKLARSTKARSAEKTVSGQVQWATDSDAAEALVLANNAELEVPGQRFPFALRLSFGVKVIADGPWPASRDRSPFNDDSGYRGGRGGGRGDAY